ncbi:MAG TPA: ribonuclease P protein subunit [Thermoplasmata archaeon]|nr:ribonuclease P protein subunit [Thermoplasmata archaeon]
MTHPGPGIDLAPSDRLAYAGEILGAPVRIAPSPAVRRPVEGVVVDETLSLLCVREPGRSRVVWVPKSSLSGSILLGGRELPLSGETLRVRPEDRTKRVLAGGPRRFR